ncbi:MAG: hypothetical protein ABI790_05925 [Betaproteobacteria bacterium]
MNTGRCLSACLKLLAIAGLASSHAMATVPNHSVEMAPVAPGPYSVACSNIAQDSARVAQIGVPIDDFWNGTDGHYIADVLLEPADTLVARPRIPNEDIYPQRRNSTVEFVVIACYPTDSGNNRPDYLLPDGQRIPHMQRQGQGPILAQQACIAIFPPPPGCGRFPLVVFSHGLAGNPVDGKSIDFLVRLASQGYIVAAPFHGDKRFSRVKIEDLLDVLYVAFNFDRLVEMQAMRPLSLKSVIDLMLAHPQFGAFIDATRIGGIGGSMGGAAMTWLLGAEITDGFVSHNSRPTVQDPRIKAAVGYVPYAGQIFLPAFGEDNATARNVTTPYLAISGTADTTAPIYMMEQAVNNFRGDRYMVALAGVEHTYDVSYGDDVFGWTIPFFAAHLNGDRAALDRLTRQKNVRGGLNDFMRIDYTAPTPLRSGEVLVEEFHNENFRRYFLTSRQSDKNIIDSGLAGPTWSRTGYAFKGYTLPGPAELRVASQAPVCRFFFPAILTHFFSAEPAECNVVRGYGTIDEGIDFWITRARDAECPSGSLALTRLYNNRWRENDSNHRYTTSRSLTAALVKEGWINEGVAMCAPL